jgi:hypothetical protein
MVYGVREGAVGGAGEGEEVVMVVFVVAEADGEAGRLVEVIEVEVGWLAVLVGGEGMAAARVTLSRRSWRTALRCLRWSLSRRVTLEAARSWVCVRFGGEAEREGRRMARRREVGPGPKVEERVDIVMSMGGIKGGLHLRARM